MTMGRRRILPFCIAAASASLLLLFLLPSARQGMAILCNRLFDWSEAVNTYVYDRFPVSRGQNTALAALLLLVFCGAWCAILATFRNKLLVMLTTLVLAGLQVYFGLALPAWGNVLLFAFLGFLLLPQPVSLKTALCYALSILTITAMILLMWPGVDAATETASERVRDDISRMAQSITGTAAEMPADRMETRRVNTQSLLTGEREAQSGKTYRLVTVEEEKISMPHWINYLKIILLLLLSIALLILPFAPFAVLNARRKKALAARQAFQSEDMHKAICSMFRHVIAWLKATGHDAGNLLFRAWPEALADRLPEDYLKQYARCAELFEMAAYSDHPMDEEQRAQMRSLMDETERMLYEQVNWKQRFRLKYVACVCE